MPFFDNETLDALSDAILEREFATASSSLQGKVTLDDLIASDGSSTLHESAREGDLETVDFFLHHGCPRTLASFDYIAHTPLIAAANKGQTEIVRRLIAAGADVNAHCDERIGSTAIKEAVGGGYVEIVKLLLAARADPTIPGWMGISAVDQAHNGIKGGGEAAQEIQRMLSKFPSTLRDKNASTKKKQKGRKQ
jgi:ankyrin repeat protein